MVMACTVIDLRIFHLLTEVFHGAGSPHLLRELTEANFKYKTAVLKFVFINVRAVLKHHRQYAPLGFDTFILCNLNFVLFHFAVGH